MAAIKPDDCTISHRHRDPYAKQLRDTPPIRRI